MGKFDSKSFNPQAFGKYVDRIPNVTKTSLQRVVQSAQTNRQELHYQVRLVLFMQEFHTSDELVDQHHRIMTALQILSQTTQQHLNRDLLQQVEWIHGKTH